MTTVPSVFDKLQRGHHEFWDEEKELGALAELGMVDVQRGQWRDGWGYSKIVTAFRPPHDTEFLKPFLASELPYPPSNAPDYYREKERRWRARVDAAKHLLLPSLDGW